MAKGQQIDLSLSTATATQKTTALKFVVLIGVVSLFADMTYEGARSITGPYLAVLGASGTIVGIVAGFGELVGYGLRLISGYISDRTGASSYLALVGMALWGLGMGAQESIMRAVIAEMIPADRRASAYGIFNAAFGLFWFLGSLLMGILYDFSLPALVASSVSLQLASVPVLLWVRTKQS